jgi:hypothetical protein
VRHSRHTQSGPAYNSRLEHVSLEVAPNALVRGMTREVHKRACSRARAVLMHNAWCNQGRRTCSPTNGSKAPKTNGRTHRQVDERGKRSGEAVKWRRQKIKNRSSRVVCLHVLSETTWPQKSDFDRIFKFSCCSCSVQLSLFCSMTSCSRTTRADGSFTHIRGTTGLAAR